MLGKNICKLLDKHQKTCKSCRALRITIWGPPDNPETHSVLESSLTVPISEYIESIKKISSIALVTYSVFEYYEHENIDLISKKMIKNTTDHYNTEYDMMILYTSFFDMLIKAKNTKVGCLLADGYAPFSLDLVGDVLLQIANNECYDSQLCIAICENGTAMCMKNGVLKKTSVATGKLLADKAVPYEEKKRLFNYIFHQFTEPNSDPEGAV